METSTLLRDFLRERARLPVYSEPLLVFYYGGIEHKHMNKETLMWGQTLLNRRLLEWGAKNRLKSAETLRKMAFGNNHERGG